MAQSTMTFTWDLNIGRRISYAVTTSLRNDSSKVQGRLRSELHRYPKHDAHLLAETAFCEVRSEDGIDTVAAGSEAPYTIYHEAGTRFFEGHPQIRTIMDEEIPTMIQNAVNAVGRL